MTSDNVNSTLIQTIDSIDVESILECYRSIENTIQFTESGRKGSQAGLQYLLEEDPHTSAVGRGRGIDHDYTLLNPTFSGTVFETIINKYNFTRTRLMWVNHMSCYSMHRDPSPRVHIPLITNEQCYFIFKSGVIQHLPVGHVYYTDTRYHHTFANCSEERRLHLVGAVDDNWITNRLTANQN